MFQVPDYNNISLALSEVMEEIGVSESIVKKRRRAQQLNETIFGTLFRMAGLNHSVYIFGSKSEGTTTLGLKSDFDGVFCNNRMNIITDWDEWKRGVMNCLIIQDENTAPGYCMLQILRPDARLPLTDLLLTDPRNEHSFRDQQGRILLKKSIILSVRPEDAEQHGPSFAVQGGQEYADSDRVHAFPCKSLLPEVRHWLQQQTPGRWPTEDMKRYIANCACFVVPVGCRGSANEDLEWRISTSLPERCLMFSLNITQIQVYVLMKMLLPNINNTIPKESHLSSFMCKTVVLHSIHITDHNAWQPHNLIQCLIFCLSVLKICVMNESCPHFIIQANNLMARKFTAETKHRLLENFVFMFNNFVVNGLFSIQTDSTGQKLIMKLAHVDTGLPNQHSSIYYRLQISGALPRQLIFLPIFNTLLSGSQTTNDQIAMILIHMRYLQQIHVYGNAVERSACTLLVSGLCTTVGSLIASTCVQNGHVISQEALDYFSLGLNSDVASSRLKLASTVQVTLAELKLSSEMWRTDMIFDCVKLYVGAMTFQQQHCPFDQKVWKMSQMNNTFSFEQRCVSPFCRTKSTVHHQNSSMKCFDLPHMIYHIEAGMTTGWTGQW